MSFVTTQPQALTAAAPTTGVVPAAADEVSALTAAQFATHAQCIKPSAPKRRRFTRCS
jgi:hypothetical protein